MQIQITAKRRKLIHASTSKKIKGRKGKKMEQKIRNLEQLTSNPTKMY